MKNIPFFKMNLIQVIFKDNEKPNAVQNEVSEEDFIVLKLKLMKFLTERCKKINHT